MVFTGEYYANPMPAINNLIDIDFYAYYYLQSSWAHGNQVNFTYTM